MAIGVLLCSADESTPIVAPADGPTTGNHLTKRLELTLAEMS